MPDRPTCPGCGARPVPTPKAKRCLACAKKLPGGAWRQLIARYRDREGEDAARAMATEQGVPYSPAASPASCTAPKHTPPPESPVKEGPPNDGAPLAPVGPQELAALAGNALRKTLERLDREIDQISPGQLAQLVKPLHGMWQEVAGGTTATRITVEFPDA